MKFIRRILGILVMIAGILGLVLSLAGLVGVWMVKPTLVSTVDSTITTLNTSIDASQQVMVIAGQTLDAAVGSVDALATMLSTTATSVEDTQPMFDQVNLLMSDTLPSTLQSISDSLITAQQAAVVLDSAIKSLENFRFLLSAVPLIGAMVDQPAQAYNPEIPLADSLGELATNLASLPDTFTAMSTSLDKADNNLVTIQTSLTTMSENVGLISTSLSDYQAMITQSQSSMQNVVTILTNVQTNLPNILKWVTIVLSLFLLWLLAAQVVILSQGWELIQGTAGRMEGGAKKVEAAESDIKASPKAAPEPDPGSKPESPSES
jgi:hypothetical protein